MTAIEKFESIGYKCLINLPTIVKFKKQNTEQEVYISIYIPTRTVSKGNGRLRSRRRFDSDFRFEEIQAIAMLLKERGGEE